MVRPVRSFPSRCARPRRRCAGSRPLAVASVGRTPRSPGFGLPGARGREHGVCFGRVGGPAGGRSARLGERRSARSRTVASCTRDRRRRDASDGLSPTQTRGGLPHPDRVFLGSGALQPQGGMKSSLTSPPTALPINSRPRRPSRLSRSSARSRSRTAPSPVDPHAHWQHHQVRSPPDSTTPPHRHTMGKNSRFFRFPTPPSPSISR